MFRKLIWEIIWEMQRIGIKELIKDEFLYLEDK